MAETTIFLDTFDGSGSLSGRTPNIGPDWVSGFAQSAGVVSAGRVGARNDQARNQVHGELALPAQEYSYISFRVRYEVLSSGSTYGEVFLGSDAPNPSRNRFIYAGYPYTDFYVNNYAGDAWGEGFESELFYPGTNEIVQVMDFAHEVYQFWINGALVLESPADDLGDPNLMAWKDGHEPLNVFMQLSTGKFDSRPLNFYVSEFEIKAEGPTERSAFWADIVKAVETI